MADNTARHVVSGGITMGSALAMAISYNINHSIPWAIVHGIFSWIYVVYIGVQ
jgi:hypothetical protein